MIASLIHTQENKLKFLPYLMITDCGQYSGAAIGTTASKKQKPSFNMTLRVSLQDSKLTGHCKLSLELYKSLMRPHCEYCGHLSPSYRKYVTKLERMQKKFTRMFPGTAVLSYRLNRLEFFYLEGLRLTLLRP